jgi:GNAT superfamily N-acetyltransferase
MRIRPATVDDAAGIAALSDQLGYPSTEREVHAFLLSLMNDDDHAVFVADSGAETAIGWVHVFRTKRVFTDAFAEVGGMIVDERFRGEGTGTELLKAAESWAREAKCPVLRIRSNVIRDQAHGFYLGLGYSLEKSQRVFERDLRE